jgi:hypothetical protein
MKHWIEPDGMLELALQQFTDRQRLANQEMEVQQQIERQQQELEQEIERQRQEMEREMEQQAAIQKTASQEFQQHVDSAFSPENFHSVDIQGLISAHSSSTDMFLIFATLMQATVNRVQSLVRQNDMLHAENRAQNAVIDQLIGQINHQQPHAADRNTAIAASVKESQEQLQHAAHRCDQCFSAEAAQ